MNILYMVTSFPSLSESFVVNEIYELEQRGHDVSVFAQERPDEDIAHDEVEEMDLTVHYAGRPSLRSFPQLLSRRVLNPSILRQSAYVDDPLYHAAYLYFGKELMKAVEAEGDVDLIHAHFAFPTRIAATYVANYFDIPCTLTAHAYEIFASPDMRRLRRLLSRLDHVVVPSEYNKRYLREDLGIGTDVSVVPATIDVDKFQPSDDCVSGRLLTVARLVEKKGHEYAIDAVADLLDRGYDVEYHVVGTGDREEFLRERVRERGVEEAVEFLGHVSDDRLQRELHEAELFVLPCVITANGDRDITPVALREAMATRTACVSTTISAIPEVITDGHDGVLVEPNDAAALADAVADLFDDPARRRTLAGNARETVETKFDIATAVDELEVVFDRVS